MRRGAFTMAPALFHRWRRPILHVSACVVIVASGAAVSLPARFFAPPTTIESAVVPVEEVPAMSLLPVLPPVPAPVSEELDAPVASPPVEDLPLTVRSYTVQAGDTVRTIAMRFGVTNETIIWENDLTDPDYLQIGQTLHILPYSGLIHDVRPGDTVASVANSYDALVRDVIGANRLSEPYIIVVGQRLAIPGGYRPLPQKVVVAPTPAAAADTVQAPPQNTDQQTATIEAPKRNLPVLGNTPQERFIASIAEAAVLTQDQTGIPASVTIAQAILESYWGSSRLAREANNYFGIKAQTRQGTAGTVWFDVWEVIGGSNVMRTEPFRAYKTIADSFVDHGRFFVENGRYAAAMAAKADPKQFARAINAAGYATDPSYAIKLIALMDRYNLYRFDTA
jgi:flagellum-specific peptidoglycan hydrolase FlgJ